MAIGADVESMLRAKFEAVFAAPGRAVGAVGAGYQMKALEDNGTLVRHHWHGEWNYTLNPKTARVEN